MATPSASYTCELPLVGQKDLRHMSEDDRNVLDSVWGRDTSLRYYPDRAFTSSRSHPWFGEEAIIVHYFRHLGVLAEMAKRTRFARSRFGYYGLIDFVVVLLYEKYKAQ